MKRHYYALADSFTGLYPDDNTSGFANTKKAVAFTSKKERDQYLATTKMLEARALTRKEALKLAYSEDAGYGYPSKVVDIAGGDYGDFVVLRK